MTTGGGSFSVLIIDLRLEDAFMFNSNLPKKYKYWISSINTDFNGIIT